MVCWRSVTQSWGKNTLKSLPGIFTHEAVKKKGSISSGALFRSLEWYPERGAARNLCRLSEMLSSQELLEEVLTALPEVCPKAGPETDIPIWSWPLGTPKLNKNTAPELLLSAHQQKKRDAGFKKSSSKQLGQENMKDWRECKRLNWPALCQPQHCDGEKVPSLGFNISAFLEHGKDRLFQQEGVSSLLSFSLW